MIARRLLRAALAVLLAAAGGSAAAHQSSDAYLRASSDAQGRLALQVDVALRDLDVVLDLDRDADGRLAWGEVRTREDEIAGHVAAHLRLNDGRCQLQAQPGLALDRKADGVYAVLRYASDCAAVPAPVLAYGLFRESDPTHRGLLAVLDADGRPTGALRSLPPGAAPVALSLAASGAPSGTESEPAQAPHDARSGFLEGFFGSGLHHILIGPDHVLFIVCLLLPLVLLGTKGAPWRPTAWAMVALVTAFTAGHSITLALASLRIVALSPSVIEPLIAATIALTALDNVKPLLRGRRALAAFVFGLVHGFGFAGPLIELDLAPGAMAWALLQFNLGVEAGQLVVVALATLVLWPLRGRPAARTLLRAGSALAGVVALVWFAERVVGFKVVPF
ncbi:MAG TPA: HupE/UreJ family protein [Methylibium sp.]|uniref:HupE/UreJ family protein n=1 Tax=Methylibium sp. TaxID=2067992 RepID=UPI002DB63463|nr:HupE/UreJ family protein [Methylibium sp.]HEU4459622.1 HupE/UreJ family protein [Methylibium sp.]